MLVRVMPELIGSLAAYLLITRIAERLQASRDGSKKADEVKDKENLLKVHLAEYDNLRKEIFERLRAQQGAFNLLVAILAATVTATG
jgi:hypothetical protein